MSLTTEHLRALSPNACAGIIIPLIPALVKAMSAGGINTPRRRAFFLAQICFESAGFRQMSECLWYTSPDRITAVFPHLRNRAKFLIRQPQALACAAYANCLGNGDEASGDGWRFRGRGLIQITGRENYTKAGGVLHIPLAEDPDLAAQPDGAADIAVWFWNNRSCNALADAGDIDGITRRINGTAMQGAKARRNLSEKAMRMFSNNRRPWPEANFTICTDRTYVPMRFRHTSENIESPHQK